MVCPGGFRVPPRPPGNQGAAGRRREPSERTDPAAALPGCGLRCHAHGQLSPSPPWLPSRRDRDCHPAPAGTVRAFPLSGSLKPFFFFFCLLQKRNLDGPGKWRLRQKVTLPRSQVRSRAISLFIWTSSPEGRPPHPAACPPLPRRSFSAEPQPTRLTTLGALSRPKTRPSDRVRGPVSPDPRVRSTHLGARSSSGGQPGSSQLERPPSSAVPGVPGRSRARGRWIDFQEEAGDALRGASVPCVFGGSLWRWTVRVPFHSPLGLGGASRPEPGTRWRPQTIWAPGAMLTPPPSVLSPPRRF